MKFNPVRYSSAVGEVWVHFMFKVKYCHNIFDTFKYRSGCLALLRKSFKKYGIRCKEDEIGFDSDHVHMILDLGIRSKPDIAKKLKGFVGRKFFKLFPELKLPRNQGGLFWGSGLWSSAYYAANPTNVDYTLNYVRTQKYGSASFNGKQYRLATFCN